MDKIIYRDPSYKIIGIIFKVQNELGKYRNEKQYSDAVENELKKSNLKYEREKDLPVSFEGKQKGRNSVFL